MSLVVCIMCYKCNYNLQRPRGLNTLQLNKYMQKLALNSKQRDLVKPDQCALCFMFIVSTPHPDLCMCVCVCFACVFIISHSEVSVDITR